MAAFAAALALGATALVRSSRQPRTHDAFLYADSAGLAPEVSGRIIEIKVRNNQPVIKGQTLLVMDPEPFELRVRQARAQVAALKAQVVLTGRQIVGQSSGADAAATQIGRARVQYKLAQDTLDRLSPLLGKGYVTTQQVDEARTNVQSSEAALTAAVQQAHQAREMVGDTDSLEAQLAGAEATEALAERDLRLSTVIAPFDGLVAGLDIAAGAYAVAGHPLFTLVKSHEWYAVANFRETELPSVTAGDGATVWMMMDNAHPVRGKVDSIGWGVAPEDGGGPSLPEVGRTLSWVVVAQRFPVRIELIDPPENLMRIGETVTVMVRHDRRD